MDFAIAYSVVLAASCVYALRYGGGPERLGAALVLAASLLSAVATSPLVVRFHSLELGVLVVDLATLAGLLALVFHSNRYWPLWATGFHTVAVVTHAATLIDRSIIPAAYAVGQSMWAYPVLFALLIGAERTRRGRTAPLSAAPC